MSEPPTSPLVEIRDVSKHFDGVVAVDRVSLDILRNELFAILGSSGCGKTTLLRMLAGFEQPTSGRIIIDGVDVTDAPPYERPVNMASQELTAAISAILAVTGTASAQDRPSSGATLEEVIVTATKREERLQDVPESITAIGSDDILKRGLLQMEDYARLVPGLSISDREPGGTTIVFRGVATSGLQFGSVSSSALYLDEQPITQSGRNPDPRLIDIERVEALRGPQGTLYGASSQSGTLRIITNPPDPSKLESWFDAQLNTVHGGDDGYDVSAMNKGTTDRIHFIFDYVPPAAKLSRRAAPHAAPDGS